MLELKPCRFCGRPACVSVSDMISPGKWRAQASCEINYGCGIAIIAKADSAEAARQRVIDAWNIMAEPVKHGRWRIEGREDGVYTSENGYGIIPVAICPFCGWEQYCAAYSDDFWQEPYNYCPNCGAKMDLEEING